MAEWKNVTDTFSEEQRHYNGKYLEIDEVYNDEVEVSVFSADDEPYEIYFNYDIFYGIVYAEKEIAERIAIKYGSKNIFDYIELSSDIAIYEIRIPNSWLGKTIVEKAVRTRYHVSILATKKDGKIYPLPQPTHVFKPDETLIVMGTAKSIKEITR